MKKNKMKSRRALLKRIKITKSGKWIHKQSNTSHLSAHKTKNQKKRLDQTKSVKSADVKRLKKLLG